MNHKFELALEWTDLELLESVKNNILLRFFVVEIKLNGKYFN